MPRSPISTNFADPIDIPIQPFVEFSLIKPANRVGWCGRQVDANKQNKVGNEVSGRVLIKVHGTAPTAIKIKRKRAVNRVGFGLRFLRDGVLL